MEEYIYTKKEAAAVLGISLPTLDRLLRAGKIRKVKVSAKRVGITSGDLQAYIDCLKAKGAGMMEGSAKAMEFTRKIDTYELLPDGTVAVLDKKGKRIGRLIKE